MTKITSTLFNSGHGSEMTKNGAFAYSRIPCKDFTWLLYLPFVLLAFKGFHVSADFRDCVIK
jgi:hypothetical protein